MRGRVARDLRSSPALDMFRRCEILAVSRGQVVVSPFHAVRLCPSPIDTATYVSCLWCSSDGEGAWGMCRGGSRGRRRGGRGSRGGRKERKWRSASECGGEERQSDGGGHRGHLDESVMSVGVSKPK